MSAEQPGAGAAEQGLERHPSLNDRFDAAVRIADYDAAWSTLADAALRRIKEALGAVAVRLEQVGSTPVPGLAAKPILDLQLSVDAIEHREGYVEPSRRSVRARITCTSARPKASTSSGMSRHGISCAPMTTRRRATPPPSKSAQSCGLGLAVEARGAKRSKVCAALGTAEGAPTKQD